MTERLAVKGDVFQAPRRWHWLNSHSPILAISFGCASHVDVLDLSSSTALLGGGSNSWWKQLWCLQQAALGNIFYTWAIRLSVPMILQWIKCCVLHALAGSCENAPDPQ